MYIEPKHKLSSRAEVTGYGFLGKSLSINRKANG